GRVLPLDEPEIRPGDAAWAQLRLEAPVVARAGDRFVLRSYSPVTTIAGGIVAEPAAPPRRRLTPEEHDALDAIITAAPEAAIAARARLASWAGVSPERIAIETPVRSARAAELLQHGELPDVALAA